MRDLRSLASRTHMPTTASNTGQSLSKDDWKYHRAVRGESAQLRRRPPTENHFKNHEIFEFKDSGLQPSSAPVSSECSHLMWRCAHGGGSSGSGVVVGRMCAETHAHRKERCLFQAKSNANKTSCNGFLLLPSLCNGRCAGYCALSHRHTDTNLHRCKKSL
jgi:hypothetical protein